MLKRYVKDITGHNATEQDGPPSPFSQIRTQSVSIVDAQVEEYLNEDSFKAGLDYGDCLSYWKNRGQTEFPCVAKVAKRVLVTGSSAASERIGFLVGRILTKQRTLLKPETVSTLISMKNIEKFESNQ